MNLFSPEKMKERILELNEEMAEPGFWENTDRAQAKNKELSSLEKKVKQLESFDSSLEDILAMIELCAELEDEDTAQEIEAELASLENAVENSLCALPSVSLYMVCIPPPLLSTDSFCVIFKFQNGFCILTPD